jgi:hypothetical protein
MRWIDASRQGSEIGGSQMLLDLFASERIAVEGLPLAALTKRKKIEALYRRRSTSREASGFRAHPC